MIYGSVCSGIEAATAAWHPLGWQPAFFSEIEPFARAVLAHHYPGVPCHGDFMTIRGDEYDAIDVLVGGTPCQDFSVAGLRAGLDGERGNLTREFFRLAARTKPRWIVWENVPGVLSIDGGRTFGAVLGALADLGYGFAYRVLDAQYFELAQRRARVFVVGCLGDWQRAAAVLFEPESLLWNPAPSRQAREGTASHLEAGDNIAGAVSSKWVKGSGGPAGDECYNLVAGTFDWQQGGAESNRMRLWEEHSGTLSANRTQAVAFAQDVADPIAANQARTYTREGSHNFRLSNVVAHALRADGFDASEDGTGRGTPLAFGLQQLTSPDNRSNPQPGDPAPTIAGDRALGIASSTAVRRLTPRECERLQGFPDDYTLVPYRNGPAKDGPRYKALGNSMAVPVMAWIGRRIQMVEEA